MSATEIIEKYEIPAEFHEAIFEAYEAGADELFNRALERMTNK